MNMKLISELGLFAFMIALDTTKSIASKKFEKGRAMELAVAENPSEELEKYVKAKHDLTVRNAVTDRERKSLNAAKKEYLKNTGFDAKKRAFHDEAYMALQSFKENMGYEEKLADIQKDMEDSIAAFKASVNYDDTIEALEKEMADAKDKWEAQEKLFATADDDISEVAMKLKHAAEDAKNETIRKAKEKKDALETQLGHEKERFEKKKRDAVRSMEEKIAKEKRRLDENCNRQVRDLENQFAEAQVKMTDDIRAMRTPEENDCMLMANDNEAFVNEQDCMDARRAAEIADRYPTSEKLGWWLKEHGWKKAGVLTVGALPMIPAGYLLYRYGKFVLEVANAV